MSREEFISICGMLWTTWFHRNRQIFESDNGDPVKVAASFNKLVADYILYTTKLMVPQQSIHY